MEDEEFQPENGMAEFDTLERLPPENDDDINNNEKEQKSEKDKSSPSVKLRLISSNESNLVLEVRDNDTFELVLDKLEEMVGHRCTFEFCYQNSWFIVDDEDTMDAFLDWAESECNSEVDIKTAETNWRQEIQSLRDKSKHAVVTRSFAGRMLYPVKTALNFWGISTGNAQPSINLVVAAAFGFVISIVVCALAYFFRELGLQKAVGDSFPEDQSQLGAICAFIAAPLFLTALCCGDLSNRWGRLQYKDWFYVRDPKLGFPDCFSLQLLRFIACGLWGIPTGIVCMVLFCVRNEVVASIQLKD